jgi:hypothetical protein
MQLIFTKGKGKYDTMEVVHESGKSERIQCPKQRIIPHDMVHYAVEHTLRVRGFLGRVKDGEGAGFQMKPESQSDSIERLVEVFQGDEWSGGNSSPADMIDLYSVTCDARQCQPLQLDPAAIQAVRARISELSIKWAAVHEGGSLRLDL